MVVFNAFPAEDPDNRADLRDGEHGHRGAVAGPIAGPWVQTW